MKAPFAIAAVVASVISSGAGATDRSQICGKYDMTGEAYCVGEKVYMQSPNDKNSSLGPYFLTSVDKSATIGTIRKPGTNTEFTVNPHKVLAASHGCGLHSAICVNDLVRASLPNKIKGSRKLGTGIFKVVGIYQSDNTDHFALAVCLNEDCSATSENTDSNYGLLTMKYSGVVRASRLSP